MGHPTMQENDTAKLTPTGYFKLKAFHVWMGWRGDVL